ncbi:hypothetical protein F5Y15DRAFT_421771 [Xylariaceae sp. FL0016]|nr:hypothetical protein F5Y15DRAFT_421771 [Xylariaceae sp. FL0016]
MAPAARPDLERFGYSSSSESDDVPPKKKNITTSSQNQKKKKKKRPQPQQSINKIWRRFNSKQFSKALSILPFDPVPLPSTPDRPNELFHAGYERARDECSRKVRKIIQECRRVNTRYRDPGFDLDWDLKMSRGNCLNYLGSKKFDISAAYISTSTNVPKAVKRVHEIFEKPTFMKNLDGADVKQGALGNCWLIASLSALANVEDGIRRICVEYDTKIGIYGFVFFRDGEWIYSIVDDKLYLTSPNWDNPSLQRDLLNQLDRDNPSKVYRKTYQTGSKALFFGQCKDQNETWVALIEKAYAKAHNDFASLTGGWIGEGLEDLSGGVTTELLTSDILDVDSFWENEVSKVNQEFLFGCSTGVVDGGYGYREGIREGHAYVIMDARTLSTGERLVKLRNPWGKTRKGIWEGPWSDGSKEWNNANKEELGHQFGNDSVFWITFEDMLEKYLHIDRTRLFREPDWRCCQRWIGVEVPWKPQWNEKFHFKLTQESPLVLTLQQLDNRYYRGLTGQYNFRLHFRVHEQGRPESEDYIVRSHGNYLMDRSVSIELPCMEPGDYSVFISVVGERDTEFSSVEDVVKRECRKREENEKLAQVGYAYDLAHSKGVIHLEQVEKLRRQSDQKKASTSRMKERRKMWEKRHLNREISKKQTKKNNEKRDKRMEAEKEKKKTAEAAAMKAAEEQELVAEQKAEAEETEKKGKEVEKPKDVAVQTEQPELSEDKSSQTESKEADSAASFDGPTPSQVADGAGGTEKPEKSEPAKATKEDTDAQKHTEEKDAAPQACCCQRSPRPPQTGKASHPPPPPPPPQAYTSDCDSSDSPVEDWELLYSSDDMAKKPRIATAPPPTTNNENVVESDGESGLPDPWNAVCIIGFRIYSKDENLDLRAVIEGGELAEGGMGEKGGADIDNAQMNAAGGRQEKKEADKVTDEVEIINGEAVHKQKIIVDDDSTENINTKDSDTQDPEDKGKDDAAGEDGNLADSELDDDDANDDEGGSGDPARSDTSDSTDSTPIHTPDSDSGPECTPQSPS